MEILILGVVMAIITFVVVMILFMIGVYMWDLRTINCETKRVRSQIKGRGKS